MGQLLVRNIEDTIVQALKARARRSGRSVEAEHRAILEQALQSESLSFVDLAANLRSTTPPQQTDATDLIRAARDHDRLSAE
jgi:plasmid stability protein